MLKEEYICTQVNLSEARGNSGKLTIETGSLAIQGGSFVSSSTFGLGNANDITIKADELIEIEGIGSRLSSDVNLEAVGDAGKINLETGNLIISNSGQISSSTFGLGNANDINIKVSKSIEIAESGSQISSSVNFGAFGDAGNINLETKDINISNSGSLSASSFIGGNGGNINIDTDTIKLVNGSSINTFSGIIDSSEVEPGNSGNLTINATDSIEIIGNNSNLNASFVGLGNAGEISLTTKKLLVTDNGFVATSALDLIGIFDVIPDSFDINPFLILINTDPNIDETVVQFINSIINGDILVNFQQGDSGDIVIEATESITLVNGNILTSGTGNALGGDVSISTPKLSLQQGTIFTNTIGFDDFGTINIFDAELIEITGGTLSSGTSINSEGNGGELNIFTQDLFVKEGGVISTSTQGLGKAGDLNIFASNLVDVSGINSSQTQNSSLSATVLAEGSGDGGDINLQAKELKLSDGGTIAASSLGVGKAGNLSLKVENSIDSNDGNITTAANQASGGEINLAAGNISLKGNTDISTNVNNGEDNGGNITLTADSIFAFDDSDIFAFAADGQGGNITLNTPAFFAENFTLNSLISDPDTLENNNRADLNATGAVSSGAVLIPDVSFIQNSLTELPDNSLNTDELVANSCVSPVGNRQQGKFMITGGDSLPVRPGNADISAFATGDVRSVPENNQSGWQPGDPIVEPQGVYRLANGKLVMSRECSNSK